VIPFGINGQNGVPSLAASGTTLGGEVTSFDDDYSTDLLSTEYDFFGEVPDPWVFLGDGTARPPSGGNGRRFARPQANVGSDLRVTGFFTSWDTTRQAGVCARFDGINGMLFLYHTDNGGEWRLVEQGGAGTIRTLLAPVPSMPLTLSIEVVGDAYVCKADGVAIDWSGAGETSVTRTGHTAALGAAFAYDDDVRITRLLIEAI
jgi:hypothetical protein